MSSEQKWHHKSLQCLWIRVMQTRMWASILTTVYYTNKTNWTDNPRMLRSDWMHFMFLNRIFCRIPVQLFTVSIQHFAWPEWGLVIGWSHSYQRRHWLFFLCSSQWIRLKVNSKRAFQSFIIQRNCSFPPWNGLMKLWRHCFRPKQPVDRRPGYDPYFMDMIGSFLGVAFIPCISSDESHTQHSPHIAAVKIVPGLR